MHIAANLALAELYPHICGSEPQCSSSRVSAPGPLTKNIPIHSPDSRESRIEEIRTNRIIKNLTESTFISVFSILYTSPGAQAIHSLIDVARVEWFLFQRSANLNPPISEGQVTRHCQGPM